MIPPFKVTDEQKQLAMMAIAGFIFIAIGWSLAIQPAVVKIQSLKKMVEESKERSELISEIQKLKIKQKSFDDLLTSEEDRHLVVGKITTLADESGFNLQSLTPTSEAGGYFTKLTLGVKSFADFYSLLHFLQVLEESKSAVLLTDLAIRPQSPYGGRVELTGTLQADLTLQTYLKK